VLTITEVASHSDFHILFFRVDIRYFDTDIFSGSGIPLLCRRTN